VIRSVDGRLRSSEGGHAGNNPFESSSERMAISASVDSDTPRLDASSAKRRLSSTLGRAVIEGTRTEEGTLLTMVLQASAFSK
jgi:hypothetical protein